jgi:squalene-hopene/tetraprenyl-beta-curcumene cyclase
MTRYRLFLAAIVCMAALAFCTQTQAAPAAQADSQPDLVARIDTALAKAARYMLSKQSADGAWRSETYGCFKDGASLTPTILNSLFFIPQGGRPVHIAYRKGAGFLVSMVTPDGEIDAGPNGLLFPVLVSSSASRVVVSYEASPANLKAQTAWLKYLRARQLNASLGWQPSDPEFGGWGFSLRIPSKPASGQMKEMFFESNMVATVFAIAALRAAKIPAEDASYKDVLAFVEKCQNFSDNAAMSDARFDDGGFVFIPNDALQNKAGVAGKDKFGRERYHSYGSMTADGFRALMRCGLPPEHPRVVAARRWLEQTFAVAHVPGVYEPDREILRDATYYYYCWAVAHSFASLKLKEVETKAGKVEWAQVLVGELIKRQKKNGSWTNNYTDAKEDDPLVATPFAAAALAICRESMTGDAKQLTPRRS